MNHPNPSAGIRVSEPKPNESKQPHTAQSAVPESSRPETYTELKKRVHAHFVYQWCNRCLGDDRATMASHLLGMDIANHEARWFAELEPERRAEVATWSRKRVNLVIADAYNAKTMRGSTLACTLMLTDSFGAKVQDAKAMARKYHLHARAVRDAEEAALAEKYPVESPC